MKIVLFVCFTIIKRARSQKILCNEAVIYTSMN